jgi:hypothetical protein
MEATWTPETLFCLSTTRCHNPEELNLNPWFRVYLGQPQKFASRVQENTRQIFVLV